MSLVPKTTTGSWSVGLIVFVPILFFVGSLLSTTMYSSVAAGNTIMEDLTTRPALAISMFTGMIAGVAACVLGLFAITKQKERNSLVYASTIIGGVLIVFLLGEVLFSH